MVDDKSSPRKPKPSPDRPTIWAEGSQKPKFDLAAFARASLHFTRRDIGTILQAAAAGTDTLSGSVAAGKYRIATGKLGRAERLIPSHQRVAGWIAAAAGILDQAGRTTRPTGQTARESRFVRTAPRPLQPAANPALSEPRPPESTGADPAAVILPKPDAHSGDEGDTLAVIRSVLDADAAAPPITLAEPGRPTASQPAPAPDTPSRLGATLTRLVGAVLGWALTLMALPYGVLRATLAHLNGEDLRNIQNDS